MVRTRSVPPRNSPVTVTPVVVIMTMPERKMEADHRARMHQHRGGVNRPVNHRCWANDHRSRLINHGRLLINDGRLLNDHLLHRGRLHLLDNHGRRLSNDHRRWLDVYGGCVDWLRFESFRKQQTGSNACHDFSRGCPLFVTSFNSRRGTAENCQRCCYHQGSFHNFTTLFCWLRRNE